MSDLFHQRLEKELSRRRDENLFRAVKVYDNCVLNLSSNDYFQLRSHPEVLRGAREAAESYGTGSGASPLLSGFLPCHENILKQLIQWKKKSFGMLFNAGFLANQAVLKHLPSKKDLILADRLIHHSMAQAMTQGHARFKRYHHLDMDHLEELLHKHHLEYETVFVVTESVFSMDGDYPDLKRLVDMKKQVPFVLILDEAHGTGVFGNTGAGLAEEMGVLAQVDIMVGTFGKSLASMGAYVLSNSSTVIDYLVNVAGEFIYSTFLPPAQVGAASAAIKIIQESHAERHALREMSVNFRKELSQLGWSENPFDSPIVPIQIENPEDTLILRDRLMEKGIWVGAVRPPTVPEGTSRLRVSLHSKVTEDHLSNILNIFREWKHQ